MNRFLRRAFPALALVILAAALAWAVSFGTLPPADFTFDNATEVKTIDPAQASGQPEGRMIDALFEGLLRSLPEGDAYKTAAPTDSVPLVPQPGVAQSYEVSSDGLTYTFHLRPTAKWSDGTTMTPEDFRFSWQRMAHPETASEYAYQLFYIQGCKAYNAAEVAVGDAVEIELPDRRRVEQLFPRGTIVRGTLKEIVTPPATPIPATASKKDRSRIEGDDAAQTVYRVEVQGVEPSIGLSVDAALLAKATYQGVIAFAKTPSPAAEKAVQAAGHKEEIRRCLHVLPDFDKTVGLLAPDPATLIIKLNQPTTFFNELMAFYPLYPVHRPSVEKYGYPGWTKAEHLVCNGAYKMQFRHLRDRTRLLKNEHYWDAAAVKLKTVDVMAIKSETTALNMYLNGQIDWSTRVQNSLVPEVRAARPTEFYTAQMLVCYFYRLNTTRPPLDQKVVRQALAAAINRQQITELVTRGGEVPARGFVPPGILGYDPPEVLKHDPAAAKRLLAEAGFSGGRGMPRLEILYNFDQSHKEIAEVIQQQWQESLGIEVGLRNLEWGVYLDSITKMDYTVARSGWIGDYPDANTFLDMFVTGGANNRTGWSNAEFDALIEQAAGEADAGKRVAILQAAEKILLDELPIIPIYYDVSTNVVRPGVTGFFSNPQDMHPLMLLDAAPRSGAKR